MYQDTQPGELIGAKPVSRGTNKQLMRLYYSGSHRGGLHLPTRDNFVVKEISHSGGYSSSKNVSISQNSSIRFETR